MHSNNNNENEIKRTNINQESRLLLYNLYKNLDIVFLWKLNSSCWWRISHRKVILIASSCRFCIHARRFLIVSFKTSYVLFCLFPYLKNTQTILSCIDIEFLNCSSVCILISHDMHIDTLEKLLVDIEIWEKSILFFYLFAMTTDQWFKFHIIILHCYNLDL